MRYIIGFLITIGLIVLVFVLIFKGFNGGNSKSTAKPLIDYANTNVQVEMFADGPINADQSHYQLEMTVGQSQTQVNLLRGYQGAVAQSKTYQNNSASFAEFLRALDLAGYSKGVTGKGVDNDPRGFCATGDRYSFLIINGNNTIQNFWATSCGGQGTFRGNTAAVKNLFIAQVPDYTDLVSDTGF